MHKVVSEDILQSLGLQDNPIITGLWQVADMERCGELLERESAADELIRYANDGFSCFDMADHYGSSELIAGVARKKHLAQHDATQTQHQTISLFTKWCPHPNECTPEAVRTGIEKRRERLDIDTIDLLQLHWWSFDHPGYIDVMDTLMQLKQEGWIRHLGLTNFDTDHLKVLLSCGYEIDTNQVCLSVLDPRALGNMSALCQETGVRLLTYGSLAGGFLSQKWLNAPEPEAVPDWSKLKYQRFITAVGGWTVFQTMLHTLNDIAQRHQVSLSNVATRWVIEQPTVAGVIIGARLTEKQHRNDNKVPLSFTLTDEDHEQIRQSCQHLTAIAGDCGTEYRRPPFLTASGDLSDHLDQLPPVYEKIAIPGRSLRWQISSGSEYELICGYSRAVRDGDRVIISGTTATHGSDRVIGGDDLQAQTVYILDKISASLAALGASMNDVIRTRIYLTDASQWEAVSRVHGRYFADCLPANTLVEVSKLVGNYAVEIEAEALIESTIAK